MDWLMRLEAIAEIRTVKARYWRAVDTRDAVLLRSVFTDVTDIDFRRSDGGTTDNDALRWSDPAIFVADMMVATESVQTIHQGFEPEIEIQSALEATALWPMHDQAWLAKPNGLIPFKGFEGYGYYHDHFRKADGIWKIERTRLERTRFQTR